MNANYKSIILAIGLFLALSAAAKAAPGDLDLSFGSGGIVVTSIINAPYFEEPTSMQVQPDGKIVVCGRIFEYDDAANTITVSFFLARYHPNGTLDASFGTNGKVVAPINPDGEFVGEDIALQPDGKIVAVGYSNIGFAVNRYNSDGTLDASFGTGGRVVTPGGLANKVAVQADGKIVVVGHGSLDPNSTGFAVVRYNPNGSLDTSFGDGGKVITLFSNPYAFAYAVMLQPDGKIVVAGHSGNSVVSSSNFALARYNADGSLDSGFGVGGKVVHVIPNSELYFNDAVLQPDGRIVVVGYVSSANSGATVIVRYNANGSVDTGFAANGIFTSPSNFFGGASDIAIQRDGKIVSIGTGRISDDSYGFAVLRLNPNGAPDSNFGTNGRVITPIGAGYSYGSAIALQADGKILGFGKTYTGDGDTAIVRYSGDYVAPRLTNFDFDGDRRADVSVFRPSDRVWYLNQSTNGFSTAQFGLSSDKITPADYDGDGKTDIAVFREGTWYWLNSSNGNFNAIQFGASTDIAIPADFDGDGRAEIAVYRPSNGTWYIYNPANNQTTGVLFGTSEDKPVPADYDGDGKADVAVFRPSDGTWYLQRSQAGFAGIAFGTSEDKPVPADYDGDGKTDVAVFRPLNGAWYLLQSRDGFAGMQFGFGTDLPVPADYDGDGKADIAVFRDGTWYLQRSQAGFTGVAFGNATDKPVPNAFVP